MSRRKQKRPQQLVSSALGSTRILTRDEQLAVKSLSAFLAADPSSSLLPTCQPPLAPYPSPGGLHNPSLPTESFPPSHSPSHPAPQSASLSDAPSSHSPDFPHPSLSSQTHSPTQHSHLAPSSQSQARSLMASPKMGVSATTTTSSSSSSSSSCVPPHPGSPSPVPEGPPSPVTPAPSPGDPPRPHLSIAVILEELRVLQQRQIYQMQMTEEICKQVLQLGGVACGLDSPPLPQLCLEGSDSVSGAPLSLPTQPSAPPLLACFPSLIPQSVSKAKAPHTMSHVLRPLKPQYEGVGGTATRVYSGSSSRAAAPASSALSASSSSSTVSTAAPHYPVSLTLGMPPRYLHEKSANTTSANSTNLPFFTPPLPASTSLPGPSQESQHTGSGSSGSSGAPLGRLSHACRFCGKLFSSDSSLQIHLRSHTGERPYQCPVCLSRFTTRGNLKVHFLRHREQNPELSLSLLPPSLFGPVSDQPQPAPGSVPPVPGVVQKRRKRRSEDDLYGEGSEGPPAAVSGFSLGSTPSARPPPATLPLPPSVDLALLSTAHSLLQLNRAAAVAAAAAVSSSTAPSSSSVTSSSSSSSMSSSSSSPLVSIASLYKGVKRFDENTPPHPAMLPHSAYSQLAHLPKILFPAAPSQHHHPSLALLRPTVPPPPGSHLASPHPQLTFPFSPYPKAHTSSSPSASSSSDTSKLQKLVEKLEKEPQKLVEENQSAGSVETTANSSAPSDFSSSLPVTTASGFSREMMAALGVSGGTGVGGGLAVLGGGPPSLAPNQCGTCLRVLSCPRALRLHQATHLGERPFPCRLCGRSFSTKGNLRAHQATHRSRTPARAHNSCPLCQRKFTNALVLQHHIRMHLGGQLPPGGGEPHPDGPSQAESRYFGAAVGPVASSSQSMGANQFPVLGGGVTPLSVSITSPSAENLSHSPSGSSSPDLIPPADLSPDPTLNPSSDPLPLGSSEPPVLSASVPVSNSRAPSSESSQADLKSSTTPILTAHSSPADSSPDKTSPVISLQKHSEGNEATPPRAPKSKQEESPETPGNHSSTPGPPPENIDTPSSDPRSCPESRTSPQPRLPDPDPPEPPVEPSASTAPLLKGDKAVVPELDALPVDAELRALPEARAVLAQSVPSRKEAREDSILSSASRDDGGKFKATGPDGDRPATQVTPPSAPRPPEKKTYSCSECGKEYASRSGLKGHMKHHGGVVKTPRQAAARPPRVTTSSSAAPTLSPAAGGPVSFWNHYQAFLSNSSDPKEEGVPCQTSGSQGEDAETSQLAESPNRPKPPEDLPSQVVSEENRNEPMGGTEAEGM